MKTKLTIAAMVLGMNIQAQEVIDVHSHIIPSDYISTLQQHDAMLDEGFPLPKWNAESQLEWMDEAGIATSVLTLAAPHPYFGDRGEAATAIRSANETAAKLKNEHPGRFLFCAALPLPDVEAAVREAVYALDSLGADGIKLATNARGQYLGTPELDTLFSVLNERKAVIILHPHRPEPVNRQVMTQTPLAMQEYLAETTRAVCNMITRNVMCRYPEIKVVVPHCGAYLPLAIQRMKSLTPVMQQNGLVGNIDWEANLASLYYDLAGAHSPEVIRLLLTITTPNHLLYGSDYPYAAPQVLTKSLSKMKQYLGDEPDLAPFRKLILGQNARMLFRIDDELNGKYSVTDNKENANKNIKDMIVRIAEIEVDPQYIDEYLAFANEVDRISVEQEPGVICLFPMQSADDATKIRILEIYSSEEAYQQHIKTNHFQRYKQGTMHMVKSLNLPTMQPLDPQTMDKIFLKMK